VGLLNMRWFLAFLVHTTLLTFYGAAASRQCLRHQQRQQ